jgi:hypothetical protein
MEISSWDIFIILIYAAIAVVQIMLFCKIWSMTNDVKRIKNILTPTSDYKRSVMIAYLTGQVDKCYDALINSTYCQLLEIARSIKKLSGYEDTFAQDIKDLEYKAERDIADAKRMCEALGKKLPSEFTSLSAFRDFYNNFYKA